MRIATEPPAEPPERLFRRLLARHPERPLETRLAGFRLTVRAITSREEADAIDAAQREVDELRASRLQSEILCRVLRVGDGPAFESVEEVGILSSGVAEQLVGEVGLALSAIAPTYARSDVDKWMAVLKRGAEHASNVYDAIALASCIDVSVGLGGRAIIPRPDRYWGCPISNLLDGHWMVFRAARAVTEKWER